MAISFRESGRLFHDEHHMFGKKQRCRVMMRAFLIKSVLLLLATSCQKKEANKPNILFITTDYTRGVDVPMAGSPFLKMPTIDRLSREGAVFIRHSCVSPICMPARATIVTGSYPHSHSLWDNTGISVKKEGKPFLITDLKKLGYKTVGIGKMHFSPFKADYDYDHRITQEGKDRHYRDDDYERYLEERGSSRKDIKNLKGDRKVPRSQSFFDWPLDEDLHPDAFVAHKTIEAIRNGVLKQDSSWFMWVSFTGPHNPWNAPGRLTAVYRNMDNLPNGDFVKGELAAKPIDFSRHRYGYGGDLFEYYDSLPPLEKDKMRHELRAAHYGSLTYIDELISEVITALEGRGLLENTMIIFTSDHGSALFDNEMLHKGAHFPTQSLVPFVVWFPGFVKPGIRRHFTSHADVYATFMELAGQQNPMATEGESMVEMFRDPEAVVNDFVVIESALVTSIMDDNWLMGIHHISKETDLYDLKSDPMCHDNLAETAQYQQVIEALKSKLVSWRKSKAQGSQVSDDPFSWSRELGDSIEIAKYRKRYINEYMRLTRIDPDRPGKTGGHAVKVLKNAGIYEPGYE